MQLSCQTLCIPGVKPPFQSIQDFLQVVLVKEIFFLNVVPDKSGRVIRVVLAVNVNPDGTVPGNLENAVTVVHFQCGQAYGFIPLLADDSLAVRGENDGMFLISVDKVMGDGSTKFLPSDVIFVEKSITLITLVVTGLAILSDQFVLLIRREFPDILGATIRAKHFFHIRCFLLYVQYACQISPPSNIRRPSP